ncbi:SDR family NAD(P)-dependent oxidoreductase [Arachidicoccus terrestris]|uniref:SDR family NAD(P)-dependent oxidoreductase n=1 Tax=Arachidicoccus terrestris TaxID=2875539 RepID=UPI001CC5B197|nr:SDR family oxidoreductase [Arachidicoccus terrestris]UAY55059.1 SDR family oxidoreductase [Arachidicoccus terrestris]
MATHNNKIALVTGGSRGLGREMALALASDGNDVIITYHTNQTQADEVVGLIKDKGVSATALQLDSRKTETFDNFFQTLNSYLKETYKEAKFDYLINNGGTALYAPFEKTTEEQFDEIINIHFKGVYFLTQKALPFLNDNGAIVNVSSGLARFSLPGSSAYGATKAAVDTLTRYMAKELGNRGIRANTIAPGAIETDFGGGHVRDNKEVNLHIANDTPLGRVGLPTDIGGVVAFLCSPRAGWINAQRIEVSGGIY